MRKSGWGRLREQLATVTEADGAAQPVLSLVQEGLREHLATEKVIAYGLQTTDEQVHGLSFVHSSERLPEHTRTWFDEYVRATPHFGNYDPIRPELVQRNRLRVWSRQEVGEANLPIIRDLYPRMGLGERAQARVLLCEGDTMLAFLGAWQLDPFDAEQLRRFRAVLPLLQRRLALEDAAKHTRYATGGSLLDAALEAISRPVLIVNDQGTVREANALAAGLLGKRRQEIAAGIRDLLHGRAPAGWSVTRVEQRGGAFDYLVLLPAEATPADSSVFRALGRSWELTGRQSDVLALLCEGRSNQSIAAVLAISPRTVEVHVSALFDKARVSTRSELVAKVLSLA